jgi:hypothetical protein
MLDRIITSQAVVLPPVSPEPLPPYFADKAGPSFVNYTDIRNLESKPLDKPLLPAYIANESADCKPPIRTIDEGCGP